MQLAEYPIIFMILLLIFFSTTSYSAPFVYNTLPLNNSMFLGGEINFSVNVTDDSLNASSVTLHIISLDAYRQNESWEHYIMYCTNYEATKWNCSKGLSFPVAGSDTTELFYFDAKNTTGSIGNNGTANETTALRFTLDRRQPFIEFFYPKNASWVSGIKMIELNVYDGVGVNISSVKYSFDKIVWLNTSLNTVTSFYNASWNTTNLTNNQVVTIFAIAADKVNNINETNVNVTVDNEFPKIEIISPTQNQFLNSTIQLRANFSDVYSGINITSALFSISGISERMDCTGSINYICTKLFDTFRLSDGTHAIIFSVSDNAGNTNSSSVQAVVSNRISSMRITEPLNNSIIRGTVLFRASLSDPTNVNYVKLITEKEEKNMSCTTDFSGCTLNLDTIQYQDGTRNISIKAMSSSGTNVVNTSLILVFDNTKPQLTVKYPGSTVNGSFSISANVTDEYTNKDKIVFQVDSFSNYMSCNNESNTKLVCTLSFDSKVLTDGTKNMTVSATDLAGNQISNSNDIIVSNTISSILPTDLTKNETSSNQTTFKNFFSKISSNKKWVFIILISVLVIIGVIVFKIKKKAERKPWRPWYETIGE